VAAAGRQIGRSARAKRDIVEVLQYTAQRWGLEQARVYADLIEEALVAISRDPNRGRARDELRRGIRSYPIAQPGRPARHVLFYRIDAAGNIQLVRLLHDSMDFGRHVP